MRPKKISKLLKAVSATLHPNCLLGCRSRYRRDRGLEMMVKEIGVLIRTLGNYTLRDYFG